MTCEKNALTSKSKGKGGTPHRWQFSALNSRRTCWGHVTSRLYTPTQPALLSILVEVHTHKDILQGDWIVRWFLQPTPNADYVCSDWMEKFFRWLNSMCDVALIKMRAQFIEGCNSLWGNPCFISACWWRRLYRSICCLTVWPQRCVCTHCRSCASITANG